MDDKLMQRFIDLQTEYDTLKANRERLSGLQFTNATELSRLRNMVEPLLEQIWLYNDMDARMELDDVLNEQRELKELARHIPSLVAKADSRLSSLSHQIRELSKQITDAQVWKSRMEKERDRITMLIGRNPLMAAELKKKLETINSQLK